MGNDLPKSSMGILILTDGVVFGEISDIVLPELTKEEKQYKAQYSPAKMIGKIAGWGEWSGLGFKVLRNGSAAQRALLTDAKAGTKRQWQVVMPPEFVASDGTSDAIQFTGFISGFKPDANGDDVITDTLTVAVDGDVTSLTAKATGISALAVADDDSHAITITPTVAAATHYYYGTAFYSATEGVNSETVTVTPTGTGTLRVNGTVVASGAASGAITIGQEIGDKTMISVVASETGKIPQIYYIEITMGDAAYTA